MHRDIRTLSLLLMGLTLSAWTFSSAAQSTTQPAGTAAQQIAAMETFNATLTAHRTQAQARVSMMRTFLKQKKQLGAYEKTDTADVQAPASLTYEQALKVALNHAQPASTNDMGPVSAEQQQRDLAALKVMGQAIFQGYEQARQQAQDMAQFMHEQKIFDEYQKWAPIQASQEQANHQAQLQKNAAADLAQSKAQHDKAQKLYQEQLARERAQKNLKLQRAFELEQQRMTDETNIRTAKFQNDDNWNRWGGRYPDVYGY